MFRDRRVHSLLTLPLLFAVALLALCPTLACATPVPAPAECGNTAQGTSPLHHHSHTPAPGGRVCSHEVVAGQAKAEVQDQHLSAGVFTLPTFAVVPPAAPVAVVDIVPPSPPPGIVLTASHLRI